MTVGFKIEPAIFTKARRKEILLSLYKRRKVYKRNLKLAENDREQFFKIKVLLQTCNDSIKRNKNRTIEREE